LVFGIDKSINAANLMYFFPFKQLIMEDYYTQEQKKQMVDIYIEEMTICHLGQA